VPLRKVLSRMKLRHLLIVIALAFIAASCSPPPELRNPAYLNDTSLISGEPCAAPCWRGITPGETSWSDARSILEDDSTITDIQIQNEEETGEIAATFQRLDGIPCCLIYTEDGEQVDQMLFQLAPEITLGEVIETHGEPEFLSLSEVSADQAAAALYYPDIFTVVYAFLSGAETGALGESSEIFAMLYVRPVDMELVLQNSSLYNWTGYGTYQSYAERGFDITPVPTVEGGSPTPEDEADEQSSDADDDVEADEAEATATAEGE